MACTFDGAPPSSGGDGSDPPPSTDASPDTGGGQTSASCTPSIALRASRRHNPTSQSIPDVRSFLTGDIFVFELPSEILVTDGSAANRCAFLDYTPPDGQRVRCGYHGAADGPHVEDDPTQIALGSRFQLINCMPADVAEFVECGGELNQVNVSHQPVRAIVLALTVDGDTDFDITTGEVLISGRCEKSDPT